MCNAAEHAFKEKSAKLLILLPLRTIYFRTFQCGTPCITISKAQFYSIVLMTLLLEGCNKDLDKDSKGS